MKRVFVLAAAAALLAAAGGFAPAVAADHEVKMLNRGAAGAMVFEPAFLKIAPGDTVTFVPTDKGHNAESIRDMAPDGASPFRGAMNKSVAVTFEEQGLYGYKCAPHYGMGMVGLIAVGEAGVNLDAAKAVKHPGKAGQAMAALFARAADRLALAE